MTAATQPASFHTPPNASSLEPAAAVAVTPSLRFVLTLHYQESYLPTPRHKTAHKRPASSDHAFFFALTTRRDAPLVMCERDGQTTYAYRLWNGTLYRRSQAARTRGQPTARAGRRGHDQRGARRTQQPVQPRAVRQFRRAPPRAPVGRGRAGLRAPRGTVLRGRAPATCASATGCPRVTVSLEPTTRSSTRPPGSRLCRRRITPASCGTSCATALRPTQPATCRRFACSSVRPCEYRDTRRWASATKLGKSSGPPARSSSGCATSAHPAACACSSVASRSCEPSSQPRPSSPDPRPASRRVKRDRRL